MGPFVPKGKRSSDKGFLANGFVAVDPSLRRRMSCMKKLDWIYSVYYYVPSLNLNGRCGCFSRNEWLRSDSTSHEEPAVFLTEARLVRMPIRTPPFVVRVFPVTARCPGQLHSYLVGQRHFCA